MSLWPEPPAGQIIELRGNRNDVHYLERTHDVLVKIVRIELVVNSVRASDGNAPHTNVFNHKRSRRMSKYKLGHD